MYVHRLGFDPAYARYSPGLVNTLDTIETAAAEGLERSSSSAERSATSRSSPTGSSRCARRSGWPVGRSLMRS